MSGQLTLQLGGRGREPVWSPSQASILEAVARPARAQGDHLMVVARAGTGKTTVLMAALARLRHGSSALLCAFNKRIEAELSLRLEAPATREALGQRGIRARVATLHSYGLRALRAHWGLAPQQDGRKDGDALRGRLALRGRAPERVPEAILRQHYGVFRATLMLAKSRPAADRAWLEYLGARLHAELGGDSDGPEACAAWLRSALAGAFTVDGRCTYDDMIYVPASKGWSAERFDVVLVDETQDLTPAQIALARAALRDGGRMILVGDNHQAIYGWRGAQDDAVARLARELGARVFHMPESRRCARAIAALAARVAPDFVAADGAPEGTVRFGVDALEMRTRWQPGDWVISRTNAPLMKLCLAAISRGLPARVAGRAGGQELTDLIEQAGFHRDRPTGDGARDALLRWIATEGREEVARLHDAELIDEAAELADRLDALVALAGYNRTLDALREQIAQLFVEDARGTDAIVFSTAHRAKGLEADRVWLLGATFGQRGWHEQELRVWYVAVTRARSELHVLNMAHPPDAPPLEDPTTRADLSRATHAPAEPT